MTNDNPHILDENEAKSNETDENIEAFEENQYYNDLILEAIEQDKIDVILSILNKDGFTLKPSILVETDNLLMYAIRNKKTELIDALFEQPKPILKKLIGYSYNRPLRPKTSAMSLAIIKEDADLIKRITDTKMPCVISDHDVYVATRRTLEVVKAFPWKTSNINLIVLGSERLTHSSMSIVSPVKVALSDAQWDKAKYMVQHEAYNPFYISSKISMEPYYFARRLGKTNPEAKEIADLILKRIEELRPRKARQLKGGFLGTGWGGHKLG